MATNVVMPQMGESVAEGTIVRWLKQIGDQIERDEPLFEISTDKVDAEIPSPVAGVLTAIHHREGETVPIHTVVAVIGSASSSAGVSPGQATASPVRVETASVAADSVASDSKDQPVQPATRDDQGPIQASSFEGQRLSPVVKKMVAEHHIDIAELAGTGIGGRVTKQDVLAYMARSSAPDGASREPEGSTRSTVAPSSPAASTTKGGGAVKPVPGTTAPMSIMRKKIAEHMIVSKNTSAHVYSVFDVNCHRIDQIRRAKKDEFERAGAKLTYLSFILKAAVDALRAVPVVNASVDGDNITYHKDVNVGVAVALDWGLIVPVIKKADEKNLLGLSRAIADVATRARAKKLSPDEVTGGTFTVTNPGSLGTLFGMPIINQPQVAILGVGVIEKRAVVIDDAIAIRAMAYLSLGYDHRIIDGATADEFMSHVKRTIEHWDFDTV